MEMINFQILACISILTTLSTECIKSLFKKVEKEYVSNIIAVCSSVVISTVACVVYPVIMQGAELSAQLIFRAVVMAFFAVLASMLGYDKIIQSLKQMEG